MTLYSTYIFRIDASRASAPENQNTTTTSPLNISILQRPLTNSWELLEKCRQLPPFERDRQICQFLARLMLSSRSLWEEAA